MTAISQAAPLEVLVQVKPAIQPAAPEAPDEIFAGARFTQEAWTRRPLAGRGGLRRRGGQELLGWSHAPTLLTAEPPPARIGRELGLGRARSVVKMENTSGVRWANDSRSGVARRAREVLR